MKYKDRRRRERLCNTCGGWVRAGHDPRCARYQRGQVRRRRYTFPIALLSIIAFAVLLGGLAR